MNAEKWCGRTGDKNSGLVDSVVCGVEAAEVLEGCLIEREEKCWRDALVDSVFGDVDKEKRKHAVNIRVG